MVRIKEYVLWLFLVMSLSGCAAYVAVGGKFTTGVGNFEVDLPSGWRQHMAAFDPVFRQVLPELVERRDLEKDVVRITRDGLNLQQIAIGIVAIGSDMTHTKRRLSQEMLPQETAEVILDDIRSNPGMTNLQIIENSAATVGGNQGFRLLYSYKSKEGLTVKAAYYGVNVGNLHYYLLYEAPQRYSLIGTMRPSRRSRRVLES